MNLYRFVPCAALVAALTTLLVEAPVASAQTLGIEAGLAGIENYDPFTLGVGATLTAPIVSRLSISASYARWFGRDGNEGALGAGGDLRLGYGNQAFLISGLVRVVGSTGTSMSAGAGVGWFQHFRIANGAIPWPSGPEGCTGCSSESWYDATPVGTLMVRFGGSNRIVPYARADVQIPSVARLNYGLIRFGAEVKLR